MKITANRNIWNATQHYNFFKLGRRIYEPIFRKFGIIIYRRRKSQMELFMEASK